MNTNKSFFLIKSTATIIALVIIVLFTSISTMAQNNVVNNDPIQKRKYTKGYFIKPSSKVKKIKKNRNAIIVKEKERERKNSEESIKIDTANTYELTNTDNNDCGNLTASNEIIPEEILINEVQKIIRIKSIKNKSANPIETKNTGGCDKIILKNGDTLMVDIMSVDETKISYLLCDSIEPTYKIEKSKVFSVTYANEGKTYYNTESYGPQNTNNFGYETPIKYTNVADNGSRSIEPVSVLALIISIIGGVIAFLPILGTVIWLIGAGISLIGMILGIIGLTKINRNRTQFKGRGISIAAISLSALVIFLVAIAFIYVIMVL